MQRSKNTNHNYSYYWVYKPFQMLSQFTREGKYDSLVDLDYNFEKDVYPVGRLDADSEGLLLLTNDPSVNHKLLSPQFHHEKKYWVQVDGTITKEAIEQLEKGVEIKAKGKTYHTQPAKVELLNENSITLIPDRVPPVRFRANIPTTWISVTLTEGKNRQIRRMTAKVGFPTLRIVRFRIEGLSLSHFNPGEVQEIERDEFYRLLKLK